ncbi:GNAT family N-acetyltransferase [Dactylosporangium sp. CA-139114]|uniref:GNAT family N-acetyltransferase n=1 Tax=Dactylosporangium sp. CA-139114 TaxID=3239931 RepID=UPI003D97776D
MTKHVLDNPAWHALHGPHARFAGSVGNAVCYHPDVAPFLTVHPDAGPEVWPDVAALAGPGAVTAVTGDAPAPPPSWEVVEDAGGVQLLDVAVDARPDPEAVVLGAADVPEILDLVARTKPGPFRQRTIELGTYLGIRREGRLIALAGERLRLEGWTEISAVCTDAAFRGQGLATRLVRAVAHGIRARGERPLLHAAATNTNAIRLYESIGFELRRRTAFRAVRVPALVGGATA